MPPQAGRWPIPFPLIRPGASALSTRWDELVHDEHVTRAQRTVEDDFTCNIGHESRNWILQSKPDSVSHDRCQELMSSKSPWCFQASDRFLSVHEWVKKWLLKNEQWLSEFHLQWTADVMCAEISSIIWLLFTSRCWNVCVCPDFKMSTVSVPWLIKAADSSAGCWWSVMSLVHSGCICPQNKAKILVHPYEASDLAWQRVTDDTFFSFKSVNLCFIR